MIYVYAIAEGSVITLPDCLGIEERPLRAEQHSGLSAIVSDHAICPSPTAANVWRHERVVEGLMSSAAVLPVRFGTAFRDMRPLVEVLEGNKERFCEGLAQVRGCVELGLRVMWEPLAQLYSSTPLSTSGREYLIRRLAEESEDRRMRQAARQIADYIHSELLGTARCGTLRLLDTPHLLCSAAYLVPREQLAEFRKRINLLKRDHSQLRMLCTGPWPPYNFSPKLQLPEVSCA